MNIELDKKGRKADKNSNLTEAGNENFNKSIKKRQ